MMKVFKKITAWLLSAIFIVNLFPISAFAPYTQIQITKLQLDDKNMIVADYTSGNKTVRSVFYAGIRTTKVTNNTTNEYDIYISDYTTEFNISNSVDEKVFVNNNLAYSNDKHIGKYAV